LLLIKLKLKLTLWTGCEIVYMFSTKVILKVCKTMSLQVMLAEGNENFCCIWFRTHFI